MKKHLRNPALTLLLMLGAILSHGQWIPKAIGLLPLDYGIGNISAANDSVIWATADDYNILSAGVNIPSNHLLYALRSVDAGETWSLIPIPIATGYISLDIQAISANKVYITTGNQSSTNFRARLLVTNDGGASWDTVAKSVVGNGLGIFFKAFNANDLLAFGYANSISYSSDQGFSFTNTTSPVLAGSESFIMISANNDIAVRGDKVWIPTSRSRVFYSTDKGVTWGTNQIPLAINRCVHTIAFSDTLNGMVSSSLNNSNFLPFQDAALATTSDGGLTWDTLPNRTRAFTNLAAIPGVPGTFITTGDSGIGRRGSMMTIDNGATWTIVDTVNFYNSVTFTDANHGWAGLGTVAGSTSPAFYKWAGIQNAISKVANEELNWSVYPNPAKDLIRIMSPEGRIRQLQLVNTLGQIVFEASVSLQQNIQIDLASFSKGVYLLRATSDTGVFSKKVIKN
ncbi:MAG: hypothetical protein JWO06_4052 [Bacteroidota bacterium]|nr:hypothetical protein [Bacteroidota bacterium]